MKTLYEVEITVLVVAWQLVHVKETILSLKKGWNAKGGWRDGLLQPHKTESLEGGVEVGRPSLNVASSQIGGSVIEGRALAFRVQMWQKKFNLPLGHLGIFSATIGIIKVPLPQPPRGPPNTHWCCQPLA